MGYPDYGCMIISLDLELMWGILDRKDPFDYSDSIRKVPTAVYHILQQFSEYGIHATWGVVGLLVEDDIANCFNHMPEEKPSYYNQLLSPYTKLKDLKSISHELLFAPELVEMIGQTEGQEIGSHTYSHYYCLEEGQTASQFCADLKRSKDVLAQYESNVRSLILPRNQICRKYAQVLKQNGIKNYRGNEERGWYYSLHSKNRTLILLSRVFRLLDSYVPLSGTNTYCYNEIVDEEGLNNIRSSRFFRPYMPRLSLIEPLRLRRIKKQMEYAAKHGQVFHIWWHPHNFGMNLAQNLTNLNEILLEYKALQQRYGFKSLNMRELGELRA